MDLRRSRNGACRQRSCALSRKMGPHAAITLGGSRCAPSQLWLRIDQEDICRACTGFSTRPRHLIAPPVRRGANCGNHRRAAREPHGERAHLDVPRGSCSPASIFPSATMLAYKSPLPHPRRLPSVPAGPPRRGITDVSTRPYAHRCPHTRSGDCCPRGPCGARCGAG